MVYGRYRKFKKGFKKYRTSRVPLKYLREMPIRRPRNKGYQFTRTMVANFPLNESIGTSSIDATTNYLYWASANDGVLGNPIDGYALQKLPNSSEFTNLYDMYKIKGVKVIFEYLHNDSSADGLTNFGLPTLCTVNDYDDGTIPANTGEMMQYQSFRMRRMDKPIKLYMRPAISCEAYKSALTTGYTSRWGQWIDIGNPDLPHYGFKWAVLSANASHSDRTIGVVRILFKYYLSFKGVR